MSGYFTDDDYDGDYDDDYDGDYDYGDDYDYDVDYVTCSLSSPPPSRSFPRPITVPDTHFSLKRRNIHLVLVVIINMPVMIILCSVSNLLACLCLCHNILLLSVFCGFRIPRNVIYLSHLLYIIFL